ncbi:MAG: magnesium transporter [Deltaproteobacteria bacterium]|nr:magnesium transporter [Deltaproteobacteria bacterium]
MSGTTVPLSADVIQRALDYRDFRVLRRYLKDSELADIADVFSDIEITSCVALYRLVPRLRRADLFAYLPFERQEELLEELPDVIVEALINEMEPDSRTRLLEELSYELRNKILLKLNPEERRVARKLLSYPEDSVGRLMTPEVLALSADMTVAQALEKIHWNTSLPVEYLNYLYVTGQNGELIGEVSLASLVVCDPRTLLVGAVMKKNYVALEPNQEGNEAVEIFRKYDTHFIPVVDQERKLLGIVTSDDVFDVAEEEATEDIQQFGGHQALEDSYFQTPFLTMVRKRAGWLAVLFISGFISGEAIRNYEELLSRWGFLVFFLTTLNSAGGNSGTQTASLIIRGLAISEISLKDVWKVLRRELLVGLTLGLILAFIGAGRALSWGLGIKVALVIATVVTIVVLLGVIAGSMLPFLFRALRLDPAVVSSPFISTIMDLSGVLLLFNIAGFVLKHFGFP